MLQLTAGPIGVFDSGIGGLTVLRALIKNFPGQNFIYLGDTARLPYGTKSPDTIRKYTEQNLKFLGWRGCQGFVIACNTASTQFPEDEFSGAPVVRVIEPGAKTALSQTKNYRIGVLATRATVTSDIYKKRLQEYESRAVVFSEAAPLLVPLAEEGLDGDLMTELAVQKYLFPLLKENIDTLILGCTHYPLLRDSILKVSRGKCALIESGPATAVALEKTFKKSIRDVEPKGKLEIFLSDVSDTSKKQIQRILGSEIQYSIHVADI